MPRGGRRPGAGAPRGNMNNLKTGVYSKQFAEVGALLASNAAIREALLAIAHKHNLRQNKADEVAALLLTRLFQRAEDIARRQSTPSGYPERAPQSSNHPGHPELAPQRTVEGLNLDIRADDLDSIKLAAGNAARRHIRRSIRRAIPHQKIRADNQTPDTTSRSQSDA